MREDSIVLDWRFANAEPDRWDYTVALYAILHPTAAEVLYLGKVDGGTVRSRWNAADKHERVWRPIKEERGLLEHRFIVGQFRTPASMRLTRQMVCDVESLLIHEIQLWANSQNTKSRGFIRPGLVVFCQGHWPFKRAIYRDE